MEGFSLLLFTITKLSSSSSSSSSALLHISLCNQSELSNIWERALSPSSRIQLLRIWRRIFSLFMDHKENACLCQSCQKMTNRSDSHKHTHAHKQIKIRLKSNKILFLPASFNFSSLPFMHTYCL